MKSNPKVKGLSAWNYDTKISLTSVDTVLFEDCCRSRSSCSYLIKPILWSYFTTAKYDIL